MATLTVGKAKVNITARGCIDCGAQWSHAWEVAKLIAVTVGGREHTIAINRCGDCMKNHQEVMKL